MNGKDTDKIPQKVSGRGWRTYGLRTLLIGVTVFAVLLAIFMRPYYETQPEREAIALLQQHGVRVGAHYVLPRGIAAIGAVFMPNHLFHRADKVVFPNTGVIPTDIELLSRLQYLDEIEFGSSSVDDDVLLKLGLCPSVATVGLSNTAVTDAGVRHIVAQCPNLVTLSLASTSTTDSGVDAIVSGLPRLKEIDLSETAITDLGLRSLAKLRSKPIVHLSGTEVTYEAIDELQGNFGNSNLAREVALKNIAALGFASGFMSSPADQKLPAALQSQVKAGQLWGHAIDPQHPLLSAAIPHLKRLVAVDNSTHLGRITQSANLRQNIHLTNVDNEAIELISQLPWLDELHLDLVVYRENILYDFAPLNKLTNLRALTISDQPRDLREKPPIDFSQWSALDNLESLDIRYHLPFEEPLAGLSQFKDLKSLRLQTSVGPRIYDEDLQEISQLAALEELALPRARITNAGLEHLSGLSNLRSLDLTGTLVVGEEFPELPLLSQLTSLDLSATSFGDEGCVEIAKLSRLQELTLDNTRLTDDGLDALWPLNRLRSFSAENTFVTFEGLAEFREVMSLGKISPKPSGYSYDKQDTNFAYPMREYSALPGYSSRLKHSTKYHTLRQRAVLAFERGDYPLMERFFDKLTYFDEGKVESWAGLATARHLQENWKGAAAAYREALSSLGEDIAADLVDTDRRDSNIDNARHAALVLLATIGRIERDMLNDSHAAMATWSRFPQFLPGDVHTIDELQSSLSAPENLSIWSTWATDPGNMAATRAVMGAMYQICMDQAETSRANEISLLNDELSKLSRYGGHYVEWFQRHQRTTPVEDEDNTIGLRRYPLDAEVFLDGELLLVPNIDMDRFPLQSAVPPPQNMHLQRLTVAAGKHTLEIRDENTGESKKTTIDVAGNVNVVLSLVNPFTNVPLPSLDRYPASEGNASLTKLPTGLLVLAVAVGRPAIHHSYDAIYISTSTDGQQWESWREFPYNGAFATGSPMLATDENGLLWMRYRTRRWWLDYSSGGWQTFATSSTDGINWTLPLPASSSHLKPRAPGLPTLKVDPSGKLQVSHDKKRNAQLTRLEEVYAKINSDLSQGIDISTGRYQPKLFEDEQGRYHVTFLLPGPVADNGMQYENSLNYMVSSDGDVWSEPVRIDQAQMFGNDNSFSAVVLGNEVMFFYYKSRGTRIRHGTLVDDRIELGDEIAIWPAIGSVTCIDDTIYLIGGRSLWSAPVDEVFNIHNRERMFQSSE